jgi:hypothetical protein
MPVLSVLHAASSPMDYPRLSLWRDERRNYGEERDSLTEEADIRSVRFIYLKEGFTS